MIKLKTLKKKKKKKKERFESTGNLVAMNIGLEQLHRNESEKKHEDQSSKQKKNINLKNIKG